MRAVVIGVVLGLCGFAGIGLVTAPARQGDVNESHTLVAPTDLGPAVAVGATIEVDCQLPDGTGYLAVVPQSPIALLVIKVTPTQLDSAPRGPFPESCDHWQKRHHVLS